MNKKTYRLSDSLIQQIETDWKERGLSSENEYIIKALQHFLTCKKTEESQALKLIPLKYPGKCTKCDKQLDQGEWAMWGRGVGVICTECHFKKYGDKITVKRLIRLKEIKWNISVAQKELDRILDKILDAEQKVNIYELGVLHEEAEAAKNKLVQLAHDYLKRGLGTDQEKQVLESVKKQIWDIEELKRKIQERVRTALFKPVKKKKKKAVAQ